MRRYCYITWGWINGKRRIALGKQSTHEIVDEEGKLALFVKERVEKLPRPMTPEEVVEFLERREVRA
ncbi:hypothetical protein E3E22_10770 [Thermococcus sp. MV5]|uniref:hypothetical protein n=1 Tax=unclassified Thermococcus TaxID=2627626 RepID=UPI00143972D6|nr:MULTISPECIES: hypothetical protein [unclassified Thermococcus]NJE06618.1 hypothetical protein [Thermococcus sp. M36]NJE27082.1 hypothetical protein [Thermococcus sp. MV5]NJE55660.1 hypothetical protein [Thermococcus sp. 21S9]